jgi:hypothetical protein
LRYSEGSPWVPNDPPRIPPNIPPNIPLLNWRRGTPGDIPEGTPGKSTGNHQGAPPRDSQGRGHGLGPGRRRGAIVLYPKASGISYLLLLEIIRSRFPNPKHLSPKHPIPQTPHDGFSNRRCQDTPATSRTTPTPRPTTDFTPAWITAFPVARRPLPSLHLSILGWGLACSRVWAFMQHCNLGWRGGPPHHIAVGHHSKNASGEG